MIPFILGIIFGAPGGVMVVALAVAASRSDECESERVIEAYRRGRAEAKPVVHRHYVIDAPTFDAIAQRKTFAKPMGATP